MKITDISLVDNTLTITLDSAAGVSKVYIDELGNVKDRYSVVDSDHTWTVTDFTNQGNIITIDISNLKPELDKSAFTVLINNVLGFYYDEKELYNKEICLLTEFCSTCLDKQ